MPRTWSNPITVQGVESEDNRIFHEFVFRDLPLAFRWDREDDGGHRGAMSVGVMTAVREATPEERAAVVERTGIDLPDDAVLWWGDGTYADTPEANAAADLAAMGAQFLSVGPGGKLEYHYEIIDSAGNVVPPNEVEIAYEKVWFGTEDADEAKEWLATLRERTAFDLYGVGGITQVDIPCFQQARIALAESASAADGEAARSVASVDGTDLTDTATGRAQVLLRRLAAGPARRPAAWYAQQPLTRYTEFSITDDGQIMGHIAPWNACHRGFSNNCVKAAYQTDFPDFHQGQVALDDGSTMRVGPITMVEGHLDSIEAYTRVMEDPACQLGSVRLYADEFGIQACGSVHPDVSPEQITRALAARPSGDWRGDRLHAIALVNVPGYAHYEEVDGEVTRMVASIPPPAPIEAITEANAFFDAPQRIVASAAAGSVAAPCSGCDEAPMPEPGLSAQGLRDLALLDEAMRLRTGR